MSADIYADNIEALKSQLQNLQQEKIDNYTSLANSITDNYNEKLQGYTEKWKGVQDAGTDELATMLGVKGIYQGTKKLYKIYQQRKQRLKGSDEADNEEQEQETQEPEEDEFKDDTFKNDAEDIDKTPQENNLNNNVDDVADKAEDEFGDEPSFLNTKPSTMERTTTQEFQQKRPSDEELEEDPFQPTRNQPVSSSFTKTGDLGDTEGLASGESEGFLSNLGNKAFTNLAERGQKIRQGAQDIKNFFSKSGGDSAEVGTDVVAEGSELATSLGVGDAILGAVPVVGEIGLAIGGLVAVGEGLYHLFHHPKQPPQPAINPPLTAPLVMTQKYSSALPSVDSAVDKASSVGTF